MMRREDMLIYGEQTLANVIDTPPSSAKTYMVRLTSGTSGTRAIIVAGEIEISGARDIGKTDGIMVICAGSLNARLSTAVLASLSSGSSLRVLPIDMRDIDSSIAILLDDLAPAGFQGVCSFIALVSSHITRETASNVRILRMTGEPLTEALESKFQEVFPNARHEQMYLASEIGKIGVRTCGYLPRNHFHSAPSVDVSVVDVDESGVGDIVVSKVFPSRPPVNSYRIGDVGRMVDMSCVCGESTVFEILGRNGMDFVKICGAIVHREAVENSLRKYRYIVNDYRVNVSETPAGRGLIALQLYCARGLGTRALEMEIAQHVATHLHITVSQTLSQFIDKGLFAPLKIEFVNAPFKVSHKDIKIIVHQ